MSTAAAETGEEAPAEGELGPLEEGLDAAQLAAVRSEAAALLVVAGPGSGKTRVLTHRIAWRAATGSMQARQAVAVTFTRRAASELRTRLRALGISDMGPVGTFHSLALAQIRRFDADNDRAERKVLANRASLSGDLAETLQHDFGPRPPLTVSGALREIDWAKARGLSVSEYRDQHAAKRLGRAAGEAAARLFESYENLTARRRVLDFDDVLAECTRLMNDDARFAAAQRWLRRHYFVDEFQDLNRLQCHLLWAWLGGAEAVAAGEADICAVGDADQAIYGWNGSDAGYMSGFDRHFADARVVRLDLNYRSHASLVEAARAAIGEDRQRPARPHETGPKPTFTAYDDDAAEAAGIAGWLAQRGAGRTRWSSFGVLARTNSQLRDIADALAVGGIPHRVNGQRSNLLSLPAARELMGELRAAGTDFATVIADLGLDARVGADARGDTYSSSSESDGAEAQARLVELAGVYLEECAMSGARRLPTGDGFADWVQAMTASGRELTSELLSLDGTGGSAGGQDGQKGAVTLATFHSAKGLSWPHVVVAGVEDGFVPMRRGDPEEERRLFYVAVSRAERTLHLTWARRRAIRWKKPSAQGGKPSSGATAGQNERAERFEQQEREPSPWLAAIMSTAVEAPPLPPEGALSHVAAARAALNATSGRT